MLENSWYNRAKERQIGFKRKVLGCTVDGEHGKFTYPNILSIADCANGGNFYCYDEPGTWQAMQQWVKKSSGKPLAYSNSNLRNLLRSEHITFNVFYPLEVLRQTEPRKLVMIVQAIVGTSTSIVEVTDIRIEYTPDKHRLNDLTSFDAYIAYRNANGQKGALGIEVKYTEKSYASNAKQKTELVDENSIYNRLTTAKNSYYKDGANFELRSKKLKQPWRNHLMGIALVEQQPKLLDEFYSVHFYPKENTYQQDVCAAYSSLLKDEKRHTFIPLTFESFVGICKPVVGSQKWLEYFEKRYLA
jgi:hypothetical protein